jgi:ATP-dependent HslUV protease ATP-binding subunit HslU
MMEKLLEEVSYDAGNSGAGGEPGGARHIVIDAAFVDDRLGALSRNEDLARYVL